MHGFYGIALASRRFSNLGVRVATTLRDMSNDGFANSDQTCQTKYFKHVKINNQIFHSTHEKKFLKKLLEAIQQTRSEKNVTHFFLWESMS